MLPKVAQKIAVDNAAKVALSHGGSEVRFYAFGDAPQEVAKPYATWQLTNGSPDEYLTCIPDADEYDFQIDVWDSTASGVVSTAKLIRDALEADYTLTFFAGSQRDFETQLFRFTMRFNGRESR